MSTVNPELLSLARQRVSFEKSAVVPPQGQLPTGDPAAGQAAPPMDPASLGMQQPVDPAQAAMGAAPQGAPAAPPGMTDPSMMGALPPATPATGGPTQAGQKMKPEQMMQMLDYRLYNMQQQLTAIMNAMGVQVAPESLVLPPGTTGAPPAESAMPGGPMAPPPAAPTGAQPPGGPMPPGGPLPPGAPPPEAGKQANWWDAIESKIMAQPMSLQTKAAAAAALRRSLTENAG